MLMPTAEGPAPMGLMALAAYLVLAAVAWAVERGAVDVGERLRAAPSRA